MRNRPIFVLRALALTAVLAGGAALADATWQVETLVPELISIRVPTTTIAFDFDSATYPPDDFPATYPARQPDGGVLPVQVFSNAAGVWSLVLDVADLRDGVSRATVPANQVLFRVDDGLWLRGVAGPQIVFTSVGPTNGWFELRIEFAIEMTGSEPAGSYRVDAVVGAIHESER